jgi:hypothetical protein
MPKGISLGGGLVLPDAHARRLDAANSYLCYGYPMPTISSDHRRLDERSLAMHRLIAAKVEANPALLEKARDNLRRWRESEGSPKLALTEWEQILRGPVSQITQFLTEQSERATRLRQSSPFAGILNEAERKAIYEPYSARTYHPRSEPNLG